MKPSGKRKKSTKSPPTSEKGMKRNAISTDSWRSSCVGSSEDWISFASLACSSHWQIPFVGGGANWGNFSSCVCSSLMSHSGLPFSDSDSDTLTSSDMRPPDIHIGSGPVQRYPQFLPGWHWTTPGLAPHLWYRVNGTRRTLPDANRTYFAGA